MQATGATPLVDFAGTRNPYVDYPGIDPRLSLQHPRSQGCDEMCFFVMGQVKKLLFKGWPDQSGCAVRAARSGAHLAPPRLHQLP